MNIDKVRLIARNMRHLVTALEKELGTSTGVSYPDFEIEDFQEVDDATSVPYITEYDEIYQ
jgi:hypothetical protein